MLPNSMLKVICTFSSFAKDLTTRFSDIVAAYAAANQAATACRAGLPFLGTTMQSELLKLDSKGCHQVEI